MKACNPSIDDGGFAFPTDNERQTGANTFHYGGMSLLDHFAGLAMQSLINKYGGDEFMSRGSEGEAYAIAGAMVQAKRSLETLSNS